MIVPSCGRGDRHAEPNVILIVLDGTRADRCSVNGYDRPTTPALEAVAREGLNFENTWSPAGWTGAAHASILTGLVPERHGFRRGSPSPLDPTIVTLAERLGEAGYETAGLIGTGARSDDSDPQRGIQGRTPYRFTHQRKLPATPSAFEQGLAFARGAHDRGEKFFLFLGDAETSFPPTPPPAFREQFRNRTIDPGVEARAASLTEKDLRAHNEGQTLLSAAELQVLSDLYDAEIASRDQALGRFVTELRCTGLLDDTLLIITSDRGENLGEHGLVHDAGSLHRIVRQVPLVIRLPGGRRAGTSCDEVVRLEDIYPTILEVCGVPLPADLDGQSLLGSILDRRARATLDRPMAASSEESREGAPGTERTGFRAVFDGRLHWIQDPDGNLEVFDLLVDPGENEPLTGVVSGSPRSDPSLRRPPETGLLRR